MLEVKNLTKIFKSKKKEKVVALNEISLKFANSGLVFIIGKSGSGKSTFLNMIGALDNPTSGSIFVDGLDISKLNNKELAYYRNEKIGFIFQDYHLLDELTVFENVNLSLKLQNKVDDKRVSETLESVGLKGYENRYPKELSGGEKQRVAIARAIIKKPSIILADEPTGNLDTKNTTQILDILKKISNDCLILIVSHSNNDWLKYASRIIRLQDGFIIDDEVKNIESDDKITYKDKVLYIPQYLNPKELTSSKSIETINNKEIIDIKIKEDAFIKNENKDEEVISETNLKKKHLKIKDCFKIGLIYLKKRIPIMLIYSLIIGTLISLIATTQSISYLDTEEVIVNSIKEETSDDIVFRKGYMKNEKNEDEMTTFYLETDEKDKEVFKDHGYNGKIYDLIAYQVSGNGYACDNHKADIFNKPQSIFQKTIGTLICDEEYLISKFGKDGELDLAIETEYKDYGVYVTDFFIDSIISLNLLGFNKYEDFLGTKFNPYNYTNQYINGIINTNYKERYKDVLFILNEKTIPNEVRHNEKLIEFLDEKIKFLDISYTTNPNFIDCIKENDFKNCLSRKGVLFMDHQNQEYEFSNFIFFHNTRNMNRVEELKDNEIILDLYTYNTVFKTNYNKNNYQEFKPHKLKIKILSESTIYNKREVAHEYEFNIIKLSIEESKANLLVSDEYFDKIFTEEQFNIGYYLKDKANLKELKKPTRDLGYMPINAIIGGLLATVEIVESFNTVFLLIFIILIACSVLILMNYNIRAIKDRIYEIGILKSLGATNSDLFLIFSLQSFFMMFLISVIYLSLGTLILLGTNKLLIASIIELSYSCVLPREINLIWFKPLLASINVLITIAIVLVSVIIPTLKMKNIKPMTIIKAKE